MQFDLKRFCASSVWRPKLFWGNEVMRVVGTRAMLLVCLFVLFGAADFPEPFSMEEYQQALEEDDFFEEEKDFGIPRVADRTGDEGDEELPRFAVDQVLVRAVSPRANLGITQESVQALINEQFNVQQGINFDANGFTPRDLLDIGRFMREMEDRGGAAGEDIPELNALMSRLENQRGYLTIEQLETIADRVTLFYRNKGLILATAYVPEQEVTDGIVYLDVLEGRLGDVAVADQQIFDENTISAAIRPEIGSTVTEERIESALRRINDLPGLRVRGSFSPGDRIGETRLTLQVQEEKAWDSRVIMDNHGSETTGEVRLFATTQWLNVGGRGHRLLVGALQSEGPDSSTFGLIEYEQPVTDDGQGRVRLNISSNEFSVARSAQLPAIFGETVNFTGIGSYQFLRGRTRNLRGEVGYTQKDVLFNVEGVQRLSTSQEIETVSVTADFLQLWDPRPEDNNQCTIFFGCYLLTGRMGLDQGHIIAGEAQGQSVDFTKILFSANLLKRFPVPNWLTKNRSYYNFILKANAQYAEKLLSSVEQFSLGGPSAARAFSVSDVSVDSGVYLGFELHFDLPQSTLRRLSLPSDSIKPFLFFDYGYGVARKLNSNDDNRDAEVKGWGLGFRMSWPRLGVANLIFAKPLTARFDSGLSDATGESRVYFDVTYEFR